MNRPEIAGLRFGISYLIGMGLGLYYGFLRPLRPRHTMLSDLLFLPALLLVKNWAARVRTTSSAS